MRAKFFGSSASTAVQTLRLEARYDTFRCLDIDIRDTDAVSRVFRDRRGEIELIVHAAAQPSHDWAASDPLTDFTVNANGTLNLLQAVAHVHAGRDVHLHVDEQGLWRPAERAAACRAGNTPRVARRAQVSRRDRHDDVDRLVHAFALRCLEGGRGSAGPGIRPLLRHADRVLPRRLSQRPEPCGRPPPRFPVLPHAVHALRATRTSSRGTRRSRSGTTSTAPISSARSLSFMSSLGGGLYTTLEAVGSATARCSKPSRCARRLPAAR